MTQNEAIGRLTLLCGRYKNHPAPDEKKHAEALKMAIDLFIRQDEPEEDDE